MTFSLKKNTTIIFCLVTSSILWAQPNKLKDSTGIKSLKQVVISASKNKELRSSTVQDIQVINLAEIENTNAPTMAELIQNSGTAFVQKSQMGGGSIVLRGFEANRIGLIIDGVRMNNAIYRGGHLQNIITIDPNMLQTVEVANGPSSALYGSDALGGVVVMQTKTPVFSKTNKSITKLNTMTRIQSAYGEKALHADYSIAWKKLALLASVSGTDFQDLRTGKKYNTRYGDWGKNTFYVNTKYPTDSLIQNNKVHIQKRSAYSQADALVKLLYQPKKYTTHSLNFQASNSSNINRYDRLSETSGPNPKFAEWYYGPQKRILTAYQLSKTNQNGFFKIYNIQLNNQWIEESRNTRRFKQAELQFRKEQVLVQGWDFNATKYINKNAEITIGYDGQYNTVQSEAQAKNIFTQLQSPLDTRYPQGGSSMLYNNVYAQYFSEASNKHININAGARWSYINTKADFGNNILGLPFADAKQNANALTGNLGINYLINNWKISLLANTGFRAPNIDDLGKVFESAGAQLIIPNANLKPEYAKNIECSITKNIDNKFYLEGNVFHTWLSNAIVLDRFSLNGADSTLYNGTLAQVTALQNKANATIKGYSFGAHVQILKGLQFKGNFTKTIGSFMQLNSTVPMDHIPPAFGRLAFLYKKNKLQLEAFCLFNDTKLIANYNPYGEDNQQFATPIGMPSWYTFNINSSYAFNANYKLQLGIENILDVHYRTFASGISSAGRNFTLAFRTSF